MTPGWYLRRLRRMSAREVAARGVVAARQWWWSDPRRRPDLLATLRPGPHRAAAWLPRQARPDGAAADAVVAAAERLLAGEWDVFHLPVAMGAPDWFRDPLTGRHAPAEAYCFKIAHRDEAAVGNIKFVWELSRHQPVTLLACAWWITGEERFADRAAALLRSWWRENPFLQGVHWVSGIEVGLRLLSWSWARALLAGWPGAQELFEQDPVFLRQLYGHCRFLAAFRSTGSSANNHLIAEWAGLATAATIFPFFRESHAWARRARAGLAREAAAQTHEDGWNREQASSYHLFVGEILVAACLAGRMAGEVMPEVEAVVGRMADALAASLDECGNPPRFGDSDDARGLLVDAPEPGAVAGLLDAGRALHGAAPWWPAEGGTVLGHLTRLLAGAAPPRALPRPARKDGAGVAILRAGRLWLRCDSGPHGYSSIAAHGHADALSIELRHAGVEVLSDPGTYCYHGETAWRGLFRGTAGHNTLSLAGADQARAGGPFLWLTQPRSTLAEWEPDRLWQASHDGYRPCIHHRQVVLAETTLTVRDWIEGPAAARVRLHFQLGPAVESRLCTGGAALAWPGGGARASLPGGLAWGSHRGESDPPLGWHSPGFGLKQPATVLAGHGVLTPGDVLETRFTFTAARV